MKLLNKLFFHSLGYYIFGIILALFCSGLLLLSRGNTEKINIVDALSTGGMIVFLIGCLQMVTYFGAFDTFGYAFSSFDSARKSKNLFAYTETKKEKRSQGNLYFVPCMTVGAVFIFISFLIWII